MISKMKIAPLLLCLLPGLSLGADIELKGKFTSKISAHVIKENNLFVTDEKGLGTIRVYSLSSLGRLTRLIRLQRRCELRPVVEPSRPVWRYR